jgi:hypothetical protein
MGQGASASLVVYWAALDSLILLHWAIMARGDVSFVLHQ